MKRTKLVFEGPQPVQEVLAPFDPRFDREDFNAKAAALGRGVLTYGGRSVPVSHGEVLYILDLNTSGSMYTRETISMVVSDRKTMEKYVNVEDGTPTTNTALFGPNVTFQTTPTHCFFWSIAKPHSELLKDVEEHARIWRKRILDAHASVTPQDPFAELERQTTRTREALQKKEQKREEQRQEKLRQKGLTKAAEDAERAARRHKRQTQRAFREQKRIDRKILRDTASECSRCHGPINKDERRFRAVLGFHCKKCGPTAGQSWSSAIDAIEGKDTLGRNKYRFGFRRADGVWVCPPGRASGTRYLIEWSVVPKSYFLRTKDGCYRTPLYVYGDSLGPFRFGGVPWWVNSGTANMASHG